MSKRKNGEWFKNKDGHWQINLAMLPIEPEPPFEYKQLGMPFNIAATERAERFAQSVCKMAVSNQSDLNIAPQATA